MTADRWQQVAETFEAALDLPLNERSAFLAGIGARDPDLRKEVEAMLEEDQRLGDPISGPERMVGERIGAYRIGRLIGEGGMGAVYEAARDDDAFDRHVAIKLLQPGLLSGHLIQRFLLERRILAQLNHPGVAALLDAGSTPNGQPYLVMEYVEGGLPIHEYCRERALPIAERVRLFIEVCGAVQYAHQNLVVHRDLKPRNILVTPEGKVKLLDFGIAKLMRTEAWVGSDLTITDAAPMTLSYASPEQVRGELITTASDVYSLGVVLYELLAGRRPYGGPDITRKQLEHAVCHVDPPLPGAADRQLAGDLDCIVMMALRKETARRYQSAAELKEDLERYLDRRPVRARRNTLTYRTVRLVRRYRWAFLAAAAVFTVLAVGLVATLTEARVAQAQRALAEQRFGEIRKLSDSFLFEFDNAISDLAGATAARQLVVRKALEYLAALDRQSGGDRQLQAELATAYERVGDIQGNPYAANLGDREGALGSYRQALRLWKTISARAPAADAARHMVTLHRSMGDTLAEDHRDQESLAEYQVALDTLEKITPGRSQKRVVLMGRIGTELSKLGRTQEGADWCRRAVEDARVLFAAGMDETAKHDIQSVYARAGKALLAAGAVDAAIAMHREEIDLCEELLKSAAPEKNAHYRRDLALAFQSFGDAFDRKKETRTAVEWYERARPIQEALLTVDSANSQMRMDLSLTMSKISEALFHIGDLAGAERARSRDIELSEQLLNDAPGSAFYHRLCAYSLFQMGELLRKQKRIAEARRYYLREAEVLKPIESDATKPTLRYVMNCYRALGEVGKNPAAGSAYLEKALAAAERLGDTASIEAIRKALHR